MIRWVLVAGVAIAAMGGCQSRPSESSTKDDAADRIERSEREAVARDDARTCERPIAVFDGSIAVASNEYVHGVERGEDYVDEPIHDLDRVFTKATRVRFTLDYPFERPFEGAVTGEITLRRTLDAIRAGFRQMYEGTTEREIPEMHNKDVTGPYGQAFHVIDDLVIEGIELCADDSLRIVIGS